MARLGFKDRLVMVLTALGLAAFAVVGWWLQASEADPHLNLPQRRMPLPNAFDFYERAATLYVPAPRATPIDAAFDWQRAPNDPSLEQRHYPPAPRLFHLQCNAEALATLRQGFAYECQYPVLPAQYPYGGRQVVHYEKLRQLAQTLRVESHWLAEHGDWKGAAASALDVIRLGTDIPRGGPLMAAMFGTSMQTSGHYELWKILPHLDSSASQAALKRSAAICALRTPFSDTMTEEKYAIQSGLMELFQTMNWRAHMISMLSGGGYNNESLTLKDKWQLQTIFKRTLMRDVTTAMDALIQQARQPYKGEISTPVYDDPYCRSFLPEYSGSRFSSTRAAATSDLLLIALALRCYHFDHGSYPAQLADLVPVYLKSVPVDAFGNATSYHYRLDGRDYRLWSIGPDGRDDGGAPARAGGDLRGNWPLGTNSSITRDSRGDIVAGINY
jgi:hypothetical protein